MKMLMEKVVGWTVGAIAAIALIGGLTVVTAQPVETLDCQNDGVTFLGQQPSEPACFSACFAVHGLALEDVLWGEANGCCRCLY